MKRRDEFELTGELREVRGPMVDGLDAALSRAAGGGEVLHSIDPRRLLSFSEGGPPVWSVAVARCQPGSGWLFLTYGLSRDVDPQAPFTHEMSMRVPGETEPPAWPIFFLRHLARYQRTSGRPLESGQLMSFAEPITRAAMRPEEQASQPDSAMHAIAIVSDPQIPSARRVYGLLDDERKLAELWSPAHLLDEIARRDPSLTTNLARPSWSSDIALASAMRRGARAEGSATVALVVPGLRWSRDGNEWIIRMPAALLPHVFQVADVRMPFGRKLLLHDYDPAPRSEVGLSPTAISIRAYGDRVLELPAPADGEIMAMLEELLNELEELEGELELRVG
jgi:hypothetical protein